MRGVKDGVGRGGGGKGVVGGAFKVAQRLEDAVFVDAEVVAGEIGDELALGVRDDDVEDDETGFDDEVGSFRGGGLGEGAERKD